MKREKFIKRTFPCYKPTRVFGSQKANETQHQLLQLACLW
ncbi:MAG: hypothetical protein JETT_3135 [Candidatus Jettenia ecosi]|uniref:Uncharacterized protein n=1 Tax=Candidatus Jettenia ecosi TaxID=2494326 RepID=A0A533Q8Q5_9BACT|nr:MAG: hypothetical protein JETT_3135 [Candidatus Jettenia ecosi]